MRYHIDISRVSLNPLQLLGLRAFTRWLLHHFYTNRVLV